MSSDSPKIVVLDGYALNPGDLSWAGLEGLGECEIYERTPVEETVERAKDAEVILTNKAVLSRETIMALPKLRYIGVTATGYNIVDVEAAREREIPVTNVPIYGTRSVAQMVFAHLFAFDTAYERAFGGGTCRTVDLGCGLVLLGFSLGRVGRPDDGNCWAWSDRSSDGKTS